MKYLLVLLLMLTSGPIMAATDLTTDSLVGHWACHDNSDDTKQASLLIYNNNGRFRIKFKLQFLDSPEAVGMRGNLVGKWSLKGNILTMSVTRSHVFMTMDDGKITTGKIGKTISVSEKTSDSEIMSFDGESMVIETKGGAGPMSCKRIK